MLLAAGAPGRRAVLPHARVVLHQPAAQGRGTDPGPDPAGRRGGPGPSDRSSRSSRHTGQSIERLRHDTDRDRVLTAEGAREYGIVDVVVNHRVPVPTFA